MTTLFERIVNPPFDPIAAPDTKIAIQGIRGMLQEVKNGFLDIGDVSTELSLDAGQNSDLITLSGYIGISADPVSMFLMLLTFWNLGELGVIPSVYRDEPTFWARVIAHG